MDEHRWQGYRKLIQSLLSCPDGEETQTLQAHWELVDAGLVELMISVAEQMAAEGDGDASWFRRYAVEIAHGLGMVAATPEEYLQFLIQVLRAIRDSRGDPQIVYPLLQANLDKLDDGLTQILQAWATKTLPTVEPQKAQFMAGDLISLGNRMQEFPQGNEASNLETALASYKSALKVYTREALPFNWATAQNNLAIAYRNRIRGARAQNLEDAIACFQNALQVLTREAFTFNWATAQYNLGLAYSNRILGDKAQNLEKAIAFYQNALQVLTREAMPVDWAMTQNDLANAYSARIRGARAENLEDAIASYQNVLEVRTREAMPVEWATTQNNLANAYNNRILGDKAQNIEYAIACNQNALEVYTREAMPVDWAMTQNNLANAYRSRILGEQAQNIEYAIACNQNALEVYTREAMPVDWAMTQNNLANAYSNRILGDKAQNIEYAIACYQNALEVYTREAFPVDWAMTQNNLANACRNRILGDQAQNIEDAIASYQNALEVYTREAMPVEWAMTQNNLANAYSNRILGDRAQNIEEAITCQHNALQVRTREAFPFNWATTQNNLAAAYSDRILGDKAQNIEEAITCQNNALQVLTREAFPVNWAMAQSNLAVAYSNRILGEQAQNLEEAITCNQNALQVRTREAMPVDWATTQNNLGLAYSNRILGEQAQNLEEAITCQHNALQVFTREAMPVHWAMTQNNLAVAYKNRIFGDHAQNIEDAIASYKSALEVRTREALPVDWAMTQSNLGLAYSDRIRGDKAQNIEDAIACNQNALEVYTREAFPVDWANTQNNLANAYSNRILGDKAQNIENAIASYKSILEVRTREALPQSHAETLYNLGLAYQDAQQFTNAYKRLAEGIATVESLRGEIISGSGIEGNKQKLAEQWHQLYSRMVEVCLELDKLTEAIEYVERSKGRNLVELLANKNLYPKADSYPNQEVYQTHCQQIAQLRREIPVIQRELEIFTRNRESEEKYRDNIKIQQQQLNYLKQQQTHLLEEINQLDSSFRFTQQVEPIPFSDIQALIDNHTAIIEWYITPNQILTFIITRHNRQPQVKQYFSEEQKALIDLTSEHLSNYYEKKDQWRTNLDELLSRLAQILHIEEILAELPQGCNQLILIPHRFLHLFPLHALPIGKSQKLDVGDVGAKHLGDNLSMKPKVDNPNALPCDNTYLLDLFPKGVRYAPSCQLLQLSQNQQRPDFSKLFAIQNPTKDLGYADLEVENILPLFPSSQVLAKQDATETAFKTNQEMPVSHCHHFSCHGKFNVRSPLESALILAKDESPEDGQLTLAEIFGLSLNQCRLVTLSACETGITPVAGSTYQYNSDEYISLPSGFLYAGSPSVVSDLWTVNDFATAFLMVKFYQNLSQFSTKETGAVAVALNQAQTWLRDVKKEELEEWTNHFSLTPTQEDALFDWFEDEEKTEQPFQSPYYWAAFCAIGK
ncbi:MAG: tetratricopeptide repeat protein [Symploca sp. SIO2C1]|nr:tetratricopeptide repeat protein [Symploca sp. SIO2C1]